MCVIKTYLWLILLLLSACNSPKTETDFKTTAELSSPVVQLTQANRSISVAELKHKLDKGETLVLIDVRTQDEVKSGKILPEALHFDILKAGFQDQISELDKSQTYYLYCKAGGRSSRAQGIMTDLGFTNVVNVEGGASAWVENGYPLEE